MKVSFFIILSFIIAQNIQAKILDYDITGYYRTLHSYKEVCQEMGHKELLLVEVENPTTLDCMSSMVNIQDFCLKKNENAKGKPFLRGYVNKKLKEVVCQYGESAVLSMACDSQHRKYCLNAKMSCHELSGIYAQKLDLFDSKIIHERNEILQCFYQNKQQELTPEVTTEIQLPYQEADVIDKDIFAFEKLKK